MPDCGHAADLELALDRTLTTAVSGRAAMGDIRRDQTRWVSDRVFIDKRQLERRPTDARHLR